MTAPGFDIGRYLLGTLAMWADGFPEPEDDGTQYRVIVESQDDDDLSLNIRVTRMDGSGSSSRYRADLRLTKLASQEDS